MSPTLHQKLYKISAPENPLYKKYDELVTLLQKYLDPQPSLRACQTNFNIKEQMIGEFISNLSIELKKLITAQEFY